MLILVDFITKSFDQAYYGKNDLANNGKGDFQRP
jgi:hypothetical protein